jgi:hypothetical protein
MIKAPTTSMALTQTDEFALPLAYRSDFANGAENSISVAAGTWHALTSKISHNTVYYFASINLDVTFASLCEEGTLFSAHVVQFESITYKAVFDSSPFPWISNDYTDAMSGSFLIGESTLDHASESLAIKMGTSALNSASTETYQALRKVLGTVINGFIEGVLASDYSHFSRAVPVVQHDVPIARIAGKRFSVKGRIRNILPRKPLLALSTDDWLALTSSDQDP